MTPCDVQAKLKTQVGVMFPLEASRRVLVDVIKFRKRSFNERNTEGP